MRSRNATRLRRTTGAVLGRKQGILQKKQHLQSTRQHAEVLGSCDRRQVRYMMWFWLHLMPVCFHRHNMSLLFDVSVEDWLPDRLTWEHKTSTCKESSRRTSARPPHINNKTDHILDTPGTLYRAANLQGLGE